MKFPGKKDVLKDLRVKFAMFVKTKKIKTYTGTSPPLFSKKAMPWGKKWPVQMNLPFFAVKASVPGGGGPESGRKKCEKCLPAGTGTKIYFSSVKTVILNTFS